MRNLYVREVCNFYSQIHIYLILYKILYKIIFRSETIRNFFKLNTYTRYNIIVQDTI